MTLCKRPQTEPACYDSRKNCSLHWQQKKATNRQKNGSSEESIGHLRILLKFNVILQRSRSYHCSCQRFIPDLLLYIIRIETRDHGRAWMLCASLFKTRLPRARKAVWFTTATVIGAISAFVDRLDSHIILRMICESKMQDSADDKAWFPYGRYVIVKSRDPSSFFRLWKNN